MNPNQLLKKKKQQQEQDEPALGREDTSKKKIILPIQRPETIQHTTQIQFEPKSPEHAPGSPFYDPYD